MAIQRNCLRKINLRVRLARVKQDHQHCEIGHIRALGIGLDLACNGGSTLGISLKRG